MGNKKKQDLKNNKSKQDIKVILKAFAMGAANVVPGVSGGTIALLTGIYTEIIDSIDALTELSFWKDIFKGRFSQAMEKINARFLVCLGIGILLSVISLAKLISFLLLYYPIQIRAFFFGLILASSYYLLKDIGKLRPKDYLFLIIGICLGLSLCLLKTSQTPNDLWFIFICGVIAICTMILPGISGSFVLLIMGKYEYIMNAINTLNMPVILVFGIACVIGLLAFAKILKFLLSKAERASIITLTGFVIGSLVKLWPWSDKEAIVRSHFMQTLHISQTDAATLGQTLLKSNADLSNLGMHMHHFAAIVCCFIAIIFVMILENNKK